MSDQRSEQLRVEGLGLMWEGRFEEALSTYERAVDAAESEGQRELAAICKADAMIVLGREGDEVRALPAIVMRRRSPRHVYFAAYVLMRNFVNSNLKRAMFYGELAVRAANEIGNPLQHAKALNALGTMYVIDSRFVESIALFEKALSALEDVTAANDQASKVLQRQDILVNLGGAKIQTGAIEEGMFLTASVRDDIPDPGTRADAAADLCLGYLQLGRYSDAQIEGEHALQLASSTHDHRLIRNAHYLLGETAFRAGRIEDAEHHFMELEAHYPDFPNLRQLLMAIDLSPMLNLRA